MGPGVYAGVVVSYVGQPLVRELGGGMSFDITHNID